MARAKKKSDNNENSSPSKSIVPKNRRKPVFKFDAQKILKDRLAENELLKKTADFNKEMKIVNDLFQAEVESVKNYKYDAGVPSKLVYAIFDHTKYNIHFKNNSSFSMTESCSQQLLLMSIEENETEANIGFNKLLIANWSPAMDVRLDIIYFSP